MSGTLKQRLLSGAGAQALNQGVQITIRIAEIPLLLSFWGNQLYGEWLMLSAIPIYLCIIDGGFTGASCREMTIRTGAGNQNGAIAIFQSTWLLLVLVSLFVFLTACIFIQAIPLSSWLKLSILTATETKLVFLILTSYVLLGFQGGLINGGFWVTGSYSTGMYLIAVTQIFEFGAFATAVIYGKGPVCAAFGYLGGRLLGTVLMWLYQIYKTPWLRHGFAQISLYELRKLAKPSFNSLSLPLGNAINIQGIRLIIGMAISPSALSLFVPMRTLSRIVIQPSNIINRLMEPELAMAFGASNWPLFKHLFTKSCQISLWGGIGTCFVVGLNTHWIYPIWTNGKVVMDYSAYSILVISGLISGIWNTASMVPYATNRYHRIAAYCLLFYGLASSIFSYIGANIQGITGVSIAIILVEIIMAFFTIFESLNLAQQKFTSWLSIVIHPPIDMAYRSLRNFLIDR